MSEGLSHHQDSSQGHHENRQQHLADELKTIAADTNTKETEKMPEKSLSEIVTKPESRRYQAGEDYTFLIHVPLQGVQARVDQLGLGEFQLDDIPLNASLIDQDHQMSFQGRNGFTIEPPTNPDHIKGIWSYDSGVSTSTRDPNQISPAKALQETRQADYNQVNVSSGRINGVYIRLRADGSELGHAGDNQQLREFAKQNNLPVAEIITKPIEFEDEPAILHQFNPELFNVTITESGIRLSLDVKKADLQETMPGDTPTNGYYSRIRQVNEYGEAGSDVTDPNEISKLLTELNKLLPTAIDPIVHAGIIATIEKYTNQANP